MVERGRRGAEKKGPLSAGLMDRGSTPTAGDERWAFKGRWTTQRATREVDHSVSVETGPRQGSVQPRARRSEYSKVPQAGRMVATLAGLYLSATDEITNSSSGRRFPILQPGLESSSFARKIKTAGERRVRPLTRRPATLPRSTPYGQ
jgi:hypothetical protein